MKIRSSLVSNSSSSSFVMLGYKTDLSNGDIINLLIDPDFVVEKDMPEGVPAEEKKEYYSKIDEYNDMIWGGEIKIDGCDKEFLVVNDDEFSRGNLTSYIGIQLAYGVDDMDIEEIELDKFSEAMSLLAEKLNRAGEKAKLIVGNIPT